MPEVSNHTRDIFGCIMTMVIQDREATAVPWLGQTRRRADRPGELVAVLPWEIEAMAGVQMRNEGSPDMRGGQI